MSSNEDAETVTLKNNSSDKKQANPSEAWRNLTAFWILGLCNNFGYVVMLTAAHDILHPPIKVIYLNLIFLCLNKTICPKNILVITEKNKHALQFFDKLKFVN